MSSFNFTRPAENLASEARGYVDAKLDNVKLRSVKALSSGTGTIFWFILVFILVGVLVLTLSFAFVMFIGEKMGSYATGAFIVSGALALILLIVFLLRKVLFKGTLIPTFIKAFFPQGKDDVKSQNELEKAIMQNEVDITRHEMKIANSYGEARQFYTNPRMFLDGATAILGWITSFFTKKK